MLTAALALVALAAPTTASAAEKNCAKAVVADWYGDGRVDQIFPLHCYRDAIKSLPVDVLDYSNAKEDILRALSFAQKGKADPGDAGTGGSSGDGGGGDDGTTSGVGGGTLPDVTDTTGEPGGTGDETLAGGGDVDTSGPSSVPVPLLVLGGLALLLLAAGGAGYANRRLQARRAGDEPDDDFPGASA